MLLFAYDRNGVKIGSFRMSLLPLFEAIQAQTDPNMNRCWRLSHNKGPVLVAKKTWSYQTATTKWVFTGKGTEEAQEEREGLFLSELNKEGLESLQVLIDQRLENPK